MLGTASLIARHPKTNKIYCISLMGGGTCTFVLQAGVPAKPRQATMLRQVLLNLVDNATKYNQPGGRVEIALIRDRNQLQLTVANTGPGIAPELLPRVFERFVRGNTQPSPGNESCGLGLTICKWIVEAHGGHLEIQSIPGKLTTVSVRLPIDSR